MHWSETTSSASQLSSNVTLECVRKVHFVSETFWFYGAFGLWLSAFGPCNVCKQLLWRRSILLPFPRLINELWWPPSFKQWTRIVWSPSPYQIHLWLRLGTAAAVDFSLAAQSHLLSDTLLFWRPSVLFQFSSQKWLQLRPFTTQVLVLSAYVLLAPCKCRSLTHPTHRCLFINPAAFRFWTCYCC